MKTVEIPIQEVTKNKALDKAAEVAWLKIKNNKK